MYTPVLEYFSSVYNDLKQSSFTISHKYTYPQVQKNNTQKKGNIPI